jgi:hypothetical protein
VRRRDATALANKLKQRCSFQLLQMLYFDAGSQLFGSLGGHRPY